MLRGSVRWVDRDWAARRYNATAAVGQRVIWIAPLLLSVAAIDVLDCPPQSAGAATILVIGGIGTLAVMLFSLYRWAVGYSRPEFHEEAAAKRRAKEAARAQRLKSSLEQDGS